MRLAGGRSEDEGRVEIHRYGYGWTTLCADQWNDEGALVVCGMLGYDHGMAVHSRTFGAGVGEIFLEIVECEGDEVSVWDCNRHAWNKSECHSGHHIEPGVRCCKSFQCTELLGMMVTNQPSVGVQVPLWPRGLGFGLWNRRFRIDPRTVFRLNPVVRYLIGCTHWSLWIFIQRRVQLT